MFDMCIGFSAIIKTLVTSANSRHGGNTNFAIFASDRDGTA